MKRTFKIAAIVMALGTATAAFAAIDTTAVVNEMVAKGYTNVQVNNHGGQIEVEGISGGQKLTLTYDAVTGALLRQETSVAEHRSGTGIGAVVGTDVTGVSTSVPGVDDDGINDDGVGEDDGNDDDNGIDDNGNDDNGNDDNGIDDNGNDDNGSHDNGGDDSGNDDNGNDDNGNDDNGTDNDD